MQKKSASRHSQKKNSPLNARPKTELLLNEFDSSSTKKQKLEALKKIVKRIAGDEAANDRGWQKAFENEFDEAL